MQPTEWKFPFKTKDIDFIELATRVRFESKNVIRFVTPTEHRDILFSLDSDGRTMHYISEVRVENLFTKNNCHKIAYSET